MTTDPNARFRQLESSKGKLERKIDNVDDLDLCASFAVLDRLEIAHQILTLGEPPKIKLQNRALNPGQLLDGREFGGEFISLKNDWEACMTMQAFLSNELTKRRGFIDYDVSDVGFFDLNIATDSGFSWHHDSNWTSFLRPTNRTYHGWFVYSCTPDCNSTLAVSGEPRFNECNTNVVLGIRSIKDNEAIKPNIIAPLQKHTLVLFPVGSVHRTYRFKEPDVLAGNRVCPSFILHHKADTLNDEKIAGLSDDELCEVFKRYRIEKELETGHFMINVLEEHPRIGPLLGRI
ncbi:MAG: hypothetical protein JWO36_2860 [Myxococcales bacterium]|nr:hypothetical protein [Myxococcales bacterium]